MKFFADKLKMFNKNAFFTGVIAQFLQYGSAIILLPLILSYFNQAEVGVYYVYITIMSLSMLVDFGLQPTFTRNIALAYSGVRRISSIGINVDSTDANESKPINRTLVNKIIYTARFIYLAESLILLAILLTIGTAYLEYVMGKELFAKNAASWIIFSFAISYSFYNSWVISLLNGSGYIRQGYKYLIANRVLNLALTSLLVINDFGLASIGLGMLISTFLSRYIALITILKYSLCTFKKYKPKLIVAYFNVLWPSAKLMGLGALSQFLILRFSQLIITAYYGLDEAGRYGATMQLLLALWHISKLVYQINIPEFVRLRVKNNYCQLNRLVKRSQTYYIIIFFLGVVAINLFANRALEQINASIRIYDGLIYILIATALFLEGNHSNACLVLTTGNKVPYIKSAYVAGVIIAITTLYIAVRNLPLIYIVACPLIVQLLYNNWYWPYFLNKELFYLMQKDKDAKDKIYK